MKPVQSLAHAKWLRQPALQKALALIKGAGGEGRIAGGAVRNALMSAPIEDVDIATTLPPQAIMKIFKKAGYGAHPTGIDHGTVTVVVDGVTFEITTLRRDVETDGRRAVVSFTDDWEEDARRRDFTMNALYCDADGNIFDPVGGYSDIRRKRIVFVGKPSARIREDFLRVLRYFRFLSVFPSLKPEELSLAACIRLRRGLLHLSPERVLQEMTKLLQGANAVKVLKLMAERQVLGHVIRFRDEFRTISRLPPDALLRAFVLAEKPEDLRENWRLSSEQARRIKELINGPDLNPKLRDNEQRRILYEIGPGRWRDAVYLSWARSRASLGDPEWKKMLSLPSRWSVPKSPLSGHDLLNAGFASGPGLGQELKRIEEVWIASDFKMEKESLLRKVKGR